MTPAPVHGWISVARVGLAFGPDLGEALLRHFQRPVDIAIEDAHLEHFQPGTIGIVEEPWEDCRPRRMADRQCRCGRVLALIALHIFVVDKRETDGNLAVGGVDFQLCLFTQGPFDEASGFLNMFRARRNGDGGAHLYYKLSTGGVP